MPDLRDILKKRIENIKKAIEKAKEEGQKTKS